MDAVLQYRIPELHPLVVHFPVALLLVAAGMAIVWMVRGTLFWRGATWLLVALGTLGAYLAFLTGEPMEAQAEGVPIVDELVGLHEDMALYTVLAGLIATVMLTAVAWTGRRTHLDADPLVLRLVAGLLVLIAAVLVAWTGHIGATMTWGVL